MCCRDEANIVINLQYAGDTLLFGKENLPQTMILKWVLMCYAKWSSLKINYHKSSLNFFGDISVNTYLISLVCNCPMQKLPIIHLGLPLTTGKLSKPLWNLLIDRIPKRLASWKSKTLIPGTEDHNDQCSVVGHAHLFPIFLRYFAMGGKGD